MSERLLIRYPLFESLSAGVLHALIDDAVSVEFETGEVLFQEGATGAWIHFLLEGHVRILRRLESGREVSLGFVREGELFGEYVLLTPHRHTATCRAASRCRVLRIPVRSVLGRLHEIGVSGSTLKQFVRLHASIHFTSGRHYLGFMSASSALTYSDVFEEEHFSAMRTLSAPGLAKDRWFRIMEGDAILSGRHGRNLELGPGDCFGSLCLAGRASDETVSTLSEVRCQSLRVSDFTTPSTVTRIKGIQPDASLHVSSDSRQTHFSRPLAKLRFPFCSQLHDSDCGLASLSMITEYLGFALRDKIYQTLPAVNECGISLLQLCELAQSLDLSAAAYRIDSEHVADLLCPFIAHLNDGHYLVVCSADKYSVLVADPATSVQCISNDALRARWSGYAVFVYVPLC